MAGRASGVLTWVLAILLALVVAGQVWVRLAPSDVATWHERPRVTQDSEFSNGVTRRVEGGAKMMDRLDAIIMATPRTTRLAGSAADGFATYITRSRFWGFPDYTSAATDGADLMIHARARFGQSDLGVNRARVDGWLVQLRGN